MGRSGHHHRPPAQLALVRRGHHLVDVGQRVLFGVRADRDLARALQFVAAAAIEVPLRLRPGGFGGLVEIVISQLVSKASANAIHQRFIDHIQPLTPDAYLAAGTETWQKIGLSRPKQAAITAVAEAINCGSLEPALLGELPVEEALSQLIAIKGIGRWSAEVYLLFCLGHRDIFPSGDLALREAARLIWDMEERPADQELKQLAQKWSPWRGVAARLLWTYYAAHKSGKQVMPL